jgi:hypothetical protein
MALLITALVVFPAIARAHQTITPSHNARLGYHSPWVGETAPRDLTAPIERVLLVLPQSEIADAAPTTVAWLGQRRPLDEAVPVLPLRAVLDPLRGPPILG